MKGGSNHFSKYSNLKVYIWNHFKGKFKLYFHNHGYWRAPLTAQLEDFSQEFIHSILFTAPEFFAEEWKFFFKKPRYIDDKCSRHICTRLSSGFPFQQDCPVPGSPGKVPGQDGIGQDLETLTEPRWAIQPQGTQWFSRIGLFVVQFIILGPYRRPIEFLTSSHPCGCSSKIPILENHWVPWGCMAHLGSVKMKKWKKMDHIPKSAKKASPIIARHFLDASF